MQDFLKRVGGGGGLTLHAGCDATPDLKKVAEWGGGGGGGGGGSDTFFFPHQKF